MATRTFLHRTETFGFDTPPSWALPALRLLFHVPRAYGPLVDAWDSLFPRSRQALVRLVESGFVEYQPAIIMDTRTMQPATQVGPAVARFRTTAKGHQLCLDVLEDPRVLSLTFTNARLDTHPALAALLLSFDLDRTHAKFGVSARHALEQAGMTDRHGRWWVNHLLATGYLRRLDDKVADVRVVIPEHWRPTRVLCRQLVDVTNAFPDVAPGLARDFRLNRNRFLHDIDPQRLGVTGTTDYDHDIECQQVLALLLRSPRLVPEGIFAVEPRLVLDVDMRRRPWPLVAGAPGHLAYQPDAELRERDDEGVRRCVIEYERYQSRRDAWSHIERFLGWLHQMALPHERAVLRFVVDSAGRERTYVALIEAFATYALEHPDRLPASPVTLEVTSTTRLRASTDALDPRAWFRLPLVSADTALRRPVLHDPASSPYQEYFRRPLSTEEE